LAYGVRRNNDSKSAMLLENGCPVFGGEPNLNGARDRALPIVVFY